MTDRTPPARTPSTPSVPPLVAGDGQRTTPLDEFSIGVLVGLLVGEGHFGGDGVRAQVTLRMHVRHERLFRWLTEAIPGSRLYGPYDHGGRRYFQWMVRGRALEHELVPLVEARLDDLDDYAAGRFRTMRDRYRLGSRAT